MFWTELNPFAPFIAAFLACSLSPIGAPTKEIQWRTDYASARREAKEKGWPLILYFTTRCNYYCVRFEDKTLRDPAVLPVINEHFIPIKVEGDSDTGFWLARDLRVELYPTVVLAKPDGKIVRTYIGFMQPEEFLALLQRALPQSGDADAQAAKAIEKLGGKITFEKIVVGEFVFDVVTEVRLRGDKVTDASLPELAALKHLKSLDLCRTKVTDECLKELASCKKLRTLLLGSSFSGSAAVADLQMALPELKIKIVVDDADEKEGG